MPAKCPVRMNERRIILFVLERLMLVAIPMEIDEELSLVPLFSSFDSPELPFPECRLGRKTTKHNGHLHGHQHSKQTKNDDKECKNPSNSLPGEQKPNGPYEDGVRGEIVRQQAVVIPNSRRPELNKIPIGGLRIYLIHARRRSIPSSLSVVDIPLFVASQRSSLRLEPQILNRISRNGSRELLPFQGAQRLIPACHSVKNWSMERAQDAVGAGGTNAVKTRLNYLVSSSMR